MRNCYATHNRSANVTSALERLRKQLGNSDKILNLGAGNQPSAARTVNVDLAYTPTLDCVADGHRLPFIPDSFALVISQEVLEHVEEPSAVLSEVHRVLRDEGLVYCQLPFVIGYHPGPTDYWRFTREGIRHLLETNGFELLEQGMSVGPATGFYRIAVEFVATIGSSLAGWAYKPVKGIAAIVLFPLTWLDRPLMSSSQADRIAGGYFVIGRKRT